MDRRAVSLHACPDCECVIGEAFAPRHHPAEVRDRMGNRESIDALTGDDYEIGRKAVEDALVELRDARILLPFRNNGLVIKEADGTRSDVIRLGVEDALRIALKAIAEAGPVVAEGEPLADWERQLVWAASAVREVHQRDNTEPYACDRCGQAWPCEAIRVWTA